MKHFIKSSVVFFMIGLCLVYGIEKKRLILSTVKDQQKIPLRSEPNIKGKILKELSDCMVVDEIDKTSQEDIVEGMINYWHKIALPDGTQGWVFGSNTSTFDPEYESKYYKDLYKELRLPDFPNLAFRQHSFSDYVYIFHLLTAVIPEEKDAETAAKLKLGQLMCLQRSLPFGVENEPPDFAAWVKENKDYIYYDEIGGQWLLKYEVLWNLHDEYKNLPVADDIAWEAANNPLRGECENDFLCYLEGFNITIGKYLRLHPDGMYAPLALESLISFFKNCLEEPPDHFGESYEGYGDPKAELELMRETLKLVLETKDKRPERALSQFEKTFEIYFKRDK